MKKLLLMFGVMALAMTAFTGCSDDDDNKDVDYGKAAAGTYDATLNVNILPETPIEADLKLNRKSNTTVDIQAVVEIPTIGAITVNANGATLSGSINSIDIACEDKIDLSETLPLDGNDDLDIEISGKVTDQKTMNLTIKITGVNMGTPTDIIITTTGATKS